MGGRQTKQPEKYKRGKLRVTEAGKADLKGQMTWNKKTIEGIGKIPLLKRRRACYCLLAFVTRIFISCLLLFPLLFLSLNGFCQPGAEIGVIGGSGYYLGEYNSRQFGHQQFYLGGLYRYNLNDRFAVRVNAGFSKIDIKGKVLLPYGDMYYPEHIRRSVKDISGWVEFNFRSFMVPKTEASSCWSPYIFAGVGYFSAGNESSASIPVGVGMKFNLFRRFSCGIEWGARKLFTDKADKLYDPWGTGETNFIFNKDWFFVAGVTFTYRFPLNAECHF